ncbi:MAG TPA: rhomboid family intramembrane serine protease, partial [Balneolaceae bacterium]|nr:rhomboid family intramembrane serine protease [Balneolaceae bacterium]
MHNQTFTGTAYRGYYNLPTAIRVIILANVAIFLVQILGAAIFGASFKFFIINWFAFVPDILVTVTQPWRLVTYMFLHGGIWHILFNMLWLWWMGRSVEEALGPRTFCAIYFGAGIGGALIDIILAQFFGIGPIIGASGAVFGVMVAFAALYPNMPIMLILLPPIKAKYVVGGLIGLNILLLNSNSGVARGVHLGGALIGYLLIEWDKRGANVAKPIYFIEHWWLRFKNLWEQKKSTPVNSNMYSV